MSLAEGAWVEYVAVGLTISNLLALGFVTRQARRAARWSRSASGRYSLRRTDAGSLRAGDTAFVWAFGSGDLGRLPVGCREEQWKLGTVVELVRLDGDRLDLAIRFSDGRTVFTRPVAPAYCTPTDSWSGRA